MKWEQCLFSIQHFELPMPREGTFSFPVPSYLTEIPAVFRKEISSSQEFLFLETYAIQPLEFRPIWSAKRKFCFSIFSLCLQWLSKVFEGNVGAFSHLLVCLCSKISEKICVADYFLALNSRDRQGFSVASPVSLKEVWYYWCLGDTVCWNGFYADIFYIIFWYL